MISTALVKLCVTRSLAPWPPQAQERKAKYDMAVAQEEARKAAIKAHSEQKEKALNDHLLVRKREHDRHRIERELHSSMRMDKVDAIQKVQTYQRQVRLGVKPKCRGIKVGKESKHGRVRSTHITAALVAATLLDITTRFSNCRGLHGVAATRVEYTYFCHLTRPAPLLLRVKNSHWDWGMLVSDIEAVGVCWFLTSKRSHDEQVMLEKILDENERTRELLRERQLLQEQRKMANINASMQRVALNQMIDKLKSGANTNKLAAGSVSMSQS